MWSARTLDSANVEKSRFKVRNARAEGTLRTSIILSYANRLCEQDYVENYAKKVVALAYGMSGDGGEGGEEVIPLPRIMLSSKISDKTKRY